MRKEEKFHVKIIFIVKFELFSIIFLNLFSIFYEYSVGY